jgi:hypothetical protein
MAVIRNTFVCFWRNSSQSTRASSFTWFLDHTHRRTPVGRTPLDEWSARCTNLYLTKYNTHNRQTSMPPVEFKPTISAGERPQTYALDRAATGTSIRKVYHLKKIHSLFFYHERSLRDSIVTRHTSQQQSSSVHFLPRKPSSPCSLALTIQTFRGSVFLGTGDVNCISQERQEWSPIETIPVTSIAMSQRSSSKIMITLPIAMHPDRNY